MDGYIDGLDREEGRGRRKKGRKNESNIEYIVYTENTASNTTGVKRAEGGQLEPHW